MAIKRCLRPLNPVLLMRQKGSGPFFQDVGVACAKSVGNYFAPGQPGSMVPSDFYAFAYDPDTFELTNKIRGIGDVDTLRVAPINVPDMNGVYHEIPGGQIAYPGARRVENLIATAGRGTTDFTAWTASDGTRDGNVFTTTGTTNPYVMVSLVPPAWGGQDVVQYRVHMTVGGGARTLRLNFNTVPASGPHVLYVEHPGGTATYDVSCPLSELYTFPEADYTGTRFVIYSATSGDGTIGDTITLHYAQIELVTGKLNKNPSHFTSEIEYYANYNGNTVDETTGFVTEANGALLDPIPSALVAPEAENVCPYSRSFLLWSATTAVSREENEVGIDGASNAACTVGDTLSGSTSSMYSVDLGITDQDTALRVWVKQTTGATTYPGIQLGSPSVAARVILNTDTGAVVAHTAPDEIDVRLQNGWWILTMSSAATAVARVAFFPAYNTTGTSVSEESAVGTSIVGQVELYVGSGISINDVVDLPPIYTDGAAAICDKDEIIIDSANLNAEEGSLYFEMIAGQDTANLLDGFLSLENGFVVIDDGTNATSTAALVDTNVESAVGMVWSAAGMKCCVNGAWSQLVPYDGTMNDGVLDLFRDATASNQMRDLQIWDSVEEQTIDLLMPTAENWGKDFVMVVRTTTDGETFTLPCGNIGTYNANIDWGDGEPDSTITTYNDADLAHTFAEAGDHTIRVNGVLPWIYFNNGGDKDKVIGVLNGGSIGSLSCEGMLRGCSNLVVADLSGFDTSLVTRMDYMFDGCSNLTALDVSGFDTSSVTSMAAMFRDCSSLITLDVSGLDTGLVANMGYMFYGCLNLTTLDVSGLDTSLVSNMSYMFYNCSNLTTLDVSGFNTALVESMSAMFYNCPNLTTLDVSGFNTASVTTMSSMFRSCSSLPTLDGNVLGTADIVSNTAVMFGTTTALSQASLDDILAKMYANRANYTWATPELDLSAPTAVPSGVYQDATPPTTGEEYRYKLENDPDGEGFNTWTITV